MSKGSEEKGAQIWMEIKTMEEVKSYRRNKNGQSGVWKCRRMPLELRTIRKKERREVFRKF